MKIKISGLMIVLTVIFSGFCKGQTVYYTYQSGLFSSPSTWTTDATGTTLTGSSVPGSLDEIVILNGRVVTVSGGSVTVSTTEIQTSGVLDLANVSGNNLGIVSGQGTLKISTSSFPAGNVSSFVSPSGGTVEYSSEIPLDLPLQGTYNHLSLSGSGLKSIGNQDLTINGDLFIQNGGLEFSSGFPAKTVTLSGNLNNQGSFNYRSGTLVFEGAGDQIISSLSGESFYNLTLNKFSGTVTLNESATLTGNLNLLSGILAVAAGQTLLLTDSSVQPVTGYSSSSFVDGVLSFSWPSFSFATRIYPVGKSGQYRPVTLSGTSGSNPVIEVSLVLPVGVSTISEGLISVSTIHQFKIEITNGAILNNPEVTLSFEGNDQVSNPATLVVAHSTDCQNWGNSGTSGYSGTPNSGTVSSSGALTSLNLQTFYALGSVDSENTLPVDLDASSVQISLENGVLAISWATESESENALWNIYRVKPESDQTELALSVNGQGSHSGRYTYNVVDKDASPFISCDYYLEDVSYNGKSTIHGPFHYIASPKQESAILYPNYPNPFNPSTTISYYLPTPGTVSYYVYNLAGKEIISFQTQKIEAGYFSEKINMQGLASGSYFCKMIAGNQSDVIKLVLLK